MIFGAATATSVANAREVAMPTRYNGSCGTYRYVQSFRKAIFLYYSLVAPGLTSWIFRCTECVSVENEVMFYRQLAFDRFQVGFKTRPSAMKYSTNSDVKVWIDPVQRNSEAVKESYMIANGYLRSKFFESLKGVGVRLDCSSVGNLCRAVFKFPLNSKAKVLAAVAAIRMFDEEGVKRCYVYICTSF